MEEERTHVHSQFSLASNAHTHHAWLCTPTHTHAFSLARTHEQSFLRPRSLAGYSSRNNSTHCVNKSTGSSPLRKHCFVQMYAEGARTCCKGSLAVSFLYIVLEVARTRTGTNLFSYVWCSHWEQIGEKNCRWKRKRPYLQMKKLFFFFDHDKFK